MTEQDLLDAARSALPPYAHAIGLSVVRLERGAPVIEMPFAENVNGRPGFFHGGALGGLLEIAGIAALQTELAQRGGDPVRFKPINITLEFLRGAKGSISTLAAGEVTRAGRRVANVSVKAWQDDVERPVAVAWINFLLSPAR